MITEKDLRDGEIIVGVQWETTSLRARRVPDGQIRLIVLKEAWREAAEAGVTLRRGPEITEVHNPSYPGDVAYMVALAIGAEPDTV